MNRYPSYKPTGVKWLGEIPSHWETIKNKFLFRESDERNTDRSYKLLSFSKSKGIIPFDENSDKENSSDNLAIYKVLHKGQLLENRLQAWNGMFLDSNIEGCVSPDYSVFDLSIKDANIRYFSYLFRTNLYVEQWANASKGIGSGFNRLYTPQFGNIISIFPPREEQDAIVSYLDERTAKIDAAIAQQQKMIDLLNERKQIIINRAVTKGLNPNAKMKDSGVEWIGEIPEGWSFVRLKHLSTIISKGTTPSTIGREILSNGNIRFIKAENIVKNEVSAFPEFYIDKTTHQILKRSNLKAGDLLFVIAGATIGKVAILPEEMTPANTNQAVSFIRLTNRNNAKYVWLVLQSDITKKYIWENAVQSAQPNISMEDLGNIQIPLPTNEDEQHKILLYVESQIEPIDKSIDSCIKQISLLQERKQIIINEVVTGKVRVV